MTITDTSCLCLHPAVCAVERDYVIILLCREKALASVVIAGETYTDSINGVMRTDTLVHKIRVPMEALDRAGHYTVHVAPLADHCNYWAKPEPTQAYEYDFRPVPADTDAPVKLYVLADTHGNAVTPAEAALLREGLQVLVLNGDIGDSADTPDMITTLHRIASTVTKGEIPVVYARGNHDTRGHNAEHLADYTPTRRGAENGATAFSFRLGPVWGLVLDAGEDKPDGVAEYGGVIDMPVFRRAQTEYFKSLIADKANEYEADGVKYRIAVCHMPFQWSSWSFSKTTPEIYAEWIHILNEMNIQLFLCGHMHWLEEVDGSIYEGEEKPAFPTILCGTWDDHPKSGVTRWVGGEYTGTEVTCADGKLSWIYTNSKGETVQI